MSSSYKYRLTAALITLLCLLPALVAGPQGAAPAKLQLVLVEGDGAINNIRERTSREPIIQVTDENNRPVAGATVFFMLPDSGATATFPDGTHSLRTVTNKQGEAVAKGLKANSEVGRFQIRIEASYQNLSVSGTLNQANAILTSSAAASSGGAAGGARAGGGSAAGTGTAGGSATSGGGLSTKVIVILAIAGAAAAGGVVAATSGSDGGSTSPPVQPPAPAIIRPGSPSFGAP